MTTKCYAMVRGSALRVTGLGSRGQIPAPIQYAVSKSVAKVTVNELAEQPSNEMLRNETEDTRLLFTRSGKTIRYTVDIDFLRVDPGLFSLVAGVSLIGRDSALGFGEGPFGLGPFGIEDTSGEIVGFDANTKRRAASFGMEVWSRLAGAYCPDTGLRQWGYTVFPFLKGGTLSGFEFSNGLVSFSLRGAQTRRGRRWSVGPYDLEGVHQRLLTPVSRNTSFRQFITTAVPPTQTDGITETEDVIDGGSASMTTSDVIDGQNVVTSPWIVEGGLAV